MFHKCKKINKWNVKTTKKKINFDFDWGSHDSLPDIDACSNSIKFTTPKDKKGKIKNNKEKKDTTQADNNENFDQTYTIWPKVTGYLLC